jgi:CHAT domain-containing protein
MARPRFAALSDGTRSLIDSYAIVYFTGAESAARPHGGVVETRSVRVLGVTQAVAGYKAVSGVADELCSIVHGPIIGLAATSEACPTGAVENGALRGEGFADAAFTESRLAALLRGPRNFSVLYVGTHFTLRPGNSLLFFLLLGDSSKLTLDRLSAMDFTGIDLLTISACQTGLGGAVLEDSREVEGLSALVQRRGAHRVVASLWEVEDRSTSKLMRDMYRAIASPRSDVPRALQRAQISLRASGPEGRHPYEHPYYWAGFVPSDAAP